MLIEIGLDTVLAYQKARLLEKASPKTINEEVMVLLQIVREMDDLIRVKMKWDKILKLAYQEYEGKALTAEEVKALYDAAKVMEPEPSEKKDLKATRSKMILSVVSLALNATLRDSKIKTLTWDRISFLKGILTVRRSRTAAGTGRTIPINTELREILEDYRTWYEAKIGPASPERYVFPYGKN
jgi:integrase